MDRAAVQRELRQRLIELFHLLAGDGIHAVVIVAELGEVPLNRKIDDDAGIFVADGTNLGVFDRRKRICHAAHACNAEGHQAAHIGVVQRHLAAFVGVFIVHIVDGVHSGDISFGQPRAVEVDAAANLVIVEHVTLHDR